MLKIGDLTDTADGNGEFTDGSVAGNIMPTELMGEWFTVVQRELIAVLTEARIQPDKANDAQLLAALKVILSEGIASSGYLIANKNLSDLESTDESRGHLGLGNSATCDVGTGKGTVAAGNDSRMVYALDRTRNLSDLNDTDRAIINLGLDTAVTRANGAAQKSSNLSDLGDKEAAKNNLGLKGGAVTDIATNAEVVAGTVSKLVTAATLTSLFDLSATAINGSIRIPNRPGGILIAWGTVPAGSDGTFTTAFSTPPFVIVQVNSTSETPFGPTHMYTVSTTTTGFSTATQSLSRKYIAIGK